MYSTVPFTPYAHLPGSTTGQALQYAPIHPMAQMGVFPNNYSTGKISFYFYFFLKIEKSKFKFQNFFR